MLALTRPVDLAPSSLEVDSNIPFRFRVDSRPIGQVITWRYTDGDRNLLEFKIDRHDGVIFGVSLVATDNTLLLADDLPCDLFTPTAGLPGVDAAAVYGDIFDNQTLIDT